MSKGPDKKARMSRRLNVEVAACFASDGVSAEGVFVEISEGGGFFHAWERIGSDTKGIFSLKLFETEPAVSISGEIIYRRQCDREEGTAQGYGVRFVDLDITAREVLARFLRTATVRRRYTINRTVVPYEKEKK